MYLDTILLGYMPLSAYVQSNIQAKEGEKTFRKCRVASQVVNAWQNLGIGVWTTETLSCAFEPEKSLQASHFILSNSWRTFIVELFVIPAVLYMYRIWHMKWRIGTLSVSESC